MKKLLVALSISAITLSAGLTSVHAAEKAQKPSAEFFKNLNHASFMPNIMKHLKKNKAKFKITGDQMKELKAYHKANSPKIKAMVQDLMKLEKKAHQMTLDNFPPEAVAKVGRQTLEIRHQLMLKKLQCRSFIKSTLSPEQYKDTLTSYK